MMESKFSKRSRGGTIISKRYIIICLKPICFNMFHEVLVFFARKLANNMLGFDVSIYFGYDAGE